MAYQTYKTYHPEDERPHAPTKHRTHNTTPGKTGR